MRNYYKKFQTQYVNNLNLLSDDRENAERSEICCDNCKQDDRDEFVNELKKQYANQTKPQKATIRNVTTYEKELFKDAVLEMANDMNAIRNFNLPFAPCSITNEQIKDITKLLDCIETNYDKSHIFPNEPYIIERIMAIINDFFGGVTVSSAHFSKKHVTDFDIQNKYIDIVDAGHNSDESDYDGIDLEIPDIEDCNI